MARDPLTDLAAFAAVASERSFTRAAKKLGLSPSALSHAMRGLEDRLGVRLLTRTTRSVASTEAGERLLTTLRPALADIESALVDVRGSRDKPAGTVRITAVKHAVTSILEPLLREFMKQYPEIDLQIDVDDGLSNIVASGYDAGIRFSGSVDKDMIAVRIGPDLRAAVVASPTYLALFPAPEVPDDLARHRCIVHRRPGGAGIYPWPLQDGERLIQLHVSGAIGFTDSDLVLNAAIAGHGVACVFADQASEHVAAGRLTEVLEPWSSRRAGYDLYYTSRRQNPPALAALIAFLRIRCEPSGRQQLPRASAPPPSS